MRPVSSVLALASRELEGMSEQINPRAGQRSRPSTGTEAPKPRSLGQQWISKGDSFTRSVAKTGGWTFKRAKPKR